LACKQHYEPLELQNFTHSERHAHIKFGGASGRQISDIKPNNFGGQWIFPAVRQGHKHSRLQRTLQLCNRVVGCQIRLAVGSASSVYTQSFGNVSQFDMSVRARRLGYKLI